MWGISFIYLLFARSLDCKLQTANLQLCQSASCKLSWQTNALIRRPKARCSPHCRLRFRPTKEGGSQKAASLLLFGQVSSRVRNGFGWIARVRDSAASARIYWRPGARATPRAGEPTRIAAARAGCSNALQLAQVATVSAALLAPLVFSCETPERRFARVEPLLLARWRR